MASEIDGPTGSPVTTTKTSVFKDSLIPSLMPYSWLRLGNVGVARVEWDWHSGEYDIKHTYNIPPNSSGGYYTSYNVWDSLDIPGMLSNFKWGESNELEARRSAEREGTSSSVYNRYTDPRGDWTVDVYVNDQWLLQEQFTVV
jgi:hypothetical protein